MPSVSVVIPVRNSAEFLRTCLDRLARSTTPPLEILVVDDASTDDSAQVAETAGARVLHTEKQSGPAAARNLAAGEARGDVLLFIDADVLAQPDTIEHVHDAFESDPELDALIGSYDDSPSSEDFLSQYKNLMHHFVHQQASGEACTFWSGCGAIRRETFLEHGGFDESYGRPAVEDIELGYRLFQAKRKMVLDRGLQVKHLKRWTFWDLLRTDIVHRGIPWTELILRDRRMPNDLNLQLSQRVSVALAFVLCGLALAGAIYWQGYFLTPLFALLFLVLGRYWGEAVSQRGSKAAIVWTSAVVAAIVASAAAYHMFGLIPPVLLGYILLIVHHRYEFEDERRRRYMSALSAFLLGFVVLLTFVYLPNNRLTFAVLIVAVAMMLLNTQFYLFLAARKSRWFAVAAIPFHLLYHFYSGISFLTGMTRYLFNAPTRARARAAAARAGHE